MDAVALPGGTKYDLAVTVCSNVAGDYPTYRGTKRLVHAPFDDPPVLAREAAAAAGEGAAVDPLPYYRRVRDEIRAWVETELPAKVPALAGKQRPLPVVLPVVETTAAPAPKPEAIGFFERYLTVWVVACMIVGALVGYYAPDVPHALEKAQFANINAIVAVLLWVMITPMLVAIDFAALWSVKENPGAVLLTSVINYAVKPFVGYGLAVLFFKVFYVGVIPDADLRNSYIAGIVLLVGAPCTAMVFVWSLLTGGHAGYTLVQVAFNDLLMLGLYVPICAALIGATNLAMPWDTIAIAVALFIAAPLFIAAVIRAVVLRRPNGKAELDRAMGVFKPVTIVALLLTLVLIFIFQGRVIGERPLHIVLLAIPITIQTVLNFLWTYAFGFATCMPHERLAPAALIATSNFFELAVAAAISIYGLGSGAALATVVGVLVEVPVMLALVWVCNKLRPTLERRIARCEEVCAWANKGPAAACCGSGGCGPRAAEAAPLAKAQLPPGSGC